MVVCWWRSLAVLFSRMGNATSVDGDPGYWYRMLTVSAWDYGFKYSIMSYGRDNAINDEIVFSTATFIYDESAPDSEINTPVNNDYYNSLAYIYGAEG